MKSDDYDDGGTTTTDVFSSMSNSRLLDNTGEDDEESLSTVDTLRTTLRLYGSIFLVLFLLYIFLRTRYPRAYNVRGTFERLGTPLAQNTYGRIRWMYKVFSHSDEVIFDQCGMDAIAFLRLLRFGFKVGLVGCFNSLYLIPTYATANDGCEEGDDGCEVITDRVDKSGLGNVTPGNHELYAASLAAYVVFGSAMYFILQEFEWFTAARHKFLSRKRPDNYTVYVQNIPVEYRSNQALYDYFSHVFSDHSVLESNITLNAPALAKNVTKRDAVVAKLEHAINVQTITGTTPQHKSKMLGGEKVDSIPAYTQELHELNAVISDSIDAIEAKNKKGGGGDVKKGPGDEADASSKEGGFDGEKATKKMSMLTVDSTFTSGSEEDEEGGGGKGGYISGSIDYISSWINPKGSGENPDASKELNGASEEGGRDGVGQSNEVGADGDKHDTDNDVETPDTSKHGSGDDDDEAVDAEATEEEPSEDDTKPRHVRLKTLDSIVGSVQTATSVVGQTATSMGQTATSMVGSVVFGPEDGQPRDAAFVSFTDIKSKASALQMIHNGKPFVMTVEEAPLPKDVYWSNVGLTHKSKQLRELVGQTLTVLLCLFWTIPVTFLSSLAEVDELKKLLPFLEDWVDTAPWLEQALAQIKPLMIVGLVTVLPYILQAFAMIEGHIAVTTVQASLFTKYSAFLVIQIFFVQLFSGSVMSELDGFIDDPMSIVDLLAQSLPAYAASFMQYVMVQTFITVAIELLRVSYVGAAMVRAKIGPNLTEKERNTIWMGLRPLSEPEDFRHARVLGKLILFFMILFVYSVMSPITSYLMCFAFALKSMAYRNQFLYIYAPLNDTGGQLWTRCIKILVACMLIAEITLFGVLLLKKGAVAAPLLVPLLVATFLFAKYLNKEHYHVTKHLPSKDCVDVDTENLMDGVDFDFLRGQYVQPEMKTKSLEPENMHEMKQ